MQQRQMLPKKAACCVLLSDSCSDVWHAHLWLYAGRPSCCAVLAPGQQLQVGEVNTETVLSLCWQSYGVRLAGKAGILCGQVSAQQRVL